MSVHPYQAVGTNTEQMLKECFIELNKSKVQATEETNLDDDIFNRVEHI